jgi:phosphopantothenoylcysteine decarboxylase/phosphopantothenate--cysteine ligase
MSSSKKKKFTNLNVLVSAGPTYEPIDPVRFIGNFSSGRMGFAVANAFADRGAHVELITGPVTGLDTNQNVNITPVQTAEQMYNAVMEKAHAADIIVMAAAVADYTPEKPARQKIKKEIQEASELTIKLIATKDILKELGQRKKEKQILVGFALETDNEIENAFKKLKNKNLDLIVLNSLQDEGAGFGHTTNKVRILSRNGNVSEYGLKDKTAVADDLIDCIANLKIKQTGVNAKIS